jgi:2-oxoglutarate ferredoxin oxidoreductase subunit alpha
MCIGAAAAGRSALTATSGPGISLYSENLGLAMMAELPLVIVDVQRLGPSTGGATTIGQGDVQFARWGTGGGYPIIVLVPHSVATCATLTVEAFKLARRFRCPVIVLTDKELNLTRATVEMPDLGGEGVERPAAGFSHFGTGEIVWLTGSTHDEHAMITKSAATIEALNRRLLAKIEANRDALAYVRVDRQSDAETLLISFGTSAGAMTVAMHRARAAGRRVSTAIVESLWPVPEQALLEAAQGVRRIVVGELNPGLYVREMRCLFPDREVVSLARIDGRLITPEMYLETCL